MIRFKQKSPNEAAAPNKSINYVWYQPNPNNLDSDATAFITATGITDSTTKLAINTLVLDFKADGLWTKMKAIYPFVGGTSTTHKYNLKNPSDTNGAFRLLFSGGWTHSSTGIDANGSNSLADTFLNPVTVLTQHNNHLSYYGRTGYVGSGLQCDIGSNNDGFFGNYLDLTNTGTPAQRFRSGLEDAQFNSSGDGFIVGSITANNSRAIYRNGTVQATNTNTATQLMANASLFIGAMNYNQGNPIIYYSNREYAFATIGDGLSASEVSDMYTAVQAFQTSLGRQV